MAQTIVGAMDPYWGSLHNLCLYSHGASSPRCINGYWLQNSGGKVHQRFAIAVNLEAIRFEF